MPPIKKPKKISTKDKRKKLRAKADKLYQTIGRMLYEDVGCLFIGCNEPYSCLHHYVPKSVCSALRYNLKNGINICNKHHCRIESSHDPDLNNQIVRIKGNEWLEELETIRRNSHVKESIEYYEHIIKCLSTIYNVDI